MERAVKRRVWMCRGLTCSEGLVVAGLWSACQLVDGWARERQMVMVMVRVR